NEPENVAPAAQWRRPTSRSVPAARPKGRSVEPQRTRLPGRSHTFVALRYAFLDGGCLPRVANRPVQTGPGWCYVNVTRRPRRRGYAFARAAVPRDDV